MVAIPPTARKEPDSTKVLASADKLAFVPQTRARARTPGLPHFRTILVGLDGTSASDPALEWASDLAKIHGARIVVATVFSPPTLDAATASGMGFYPGYTKAYEEVREILERAAADATEKLKARGLAAERVVTTGNPAHELAEIAETHRADLVVLGATRRGRIARALLGSTTSGLLDRTPASVLVARTPTRPSKILVATDGSSSASRAVAYAVRQAEATRAEITVLHVLEYPDSAKDLPTTGYLKDVLVKMKLEAPPSLRYELDAGRPAERILQHSEEADVGLVVLGSRGLGRVLGPILGSVSRKVVHECEASVLVMKDPHAP